MSPYIKTPDSTPSAPQLRPERLLTPGEVASLFRVDSKTVTRWAKTGKLRAIRTLGGHRRYRETDIRAALGDVDGLAWDPKPEAGSP